MSCKNLSLSEVFIPRARIRWDVARIFKRFLIRDSNVVLNWKNVAATVPRSDENVVFFFFNVFFIVLIVLRFVAATERAVRLPYTKPLVIKLVSLQALVTFRLVYFPFYFICYLFDFNSVICQHQSSRAFPFLLFPFLVAFIICVVVASPKWKSIFH